MPAIKELSKGSGARVQVRLDEDTAMFYRKKAQENGTTLSEYLRQTLLKG